MPRHRLRDATWASLHAKLRAVSGIWKRDIERLRQFVEAVVYVLRTGVAWEDLPERFGKPNSLYRRFRRWSQQGIWDALFTAGVPEDALETVMVDATITKAQRFASGARGGGAEDLGRSRGGLTTKIHSLADHRGRPLCYLLTPGQAADCRHAESLLEGVSFAYLIGDRAYDTDALRAWCAEHGVEAVIPRSGTARCRSRMIGCGIEPGTGSRTSSGGRKTTPGSSCARTRPHAAMLASSASPSP